MGDGYKWSQFGGTSCAVPTVGGKAACWMEKYYTLNGAWPSPNQVKAAMISEVRATPLSVKTTNWSSVPTASGTDINPQQHISSSPCLKIQAGTTAPMVVIEWLILQVHHLVKHFGMHRILTENKHIRKDRQLVCYFQDHVNLI